MYHSLRVSFDANQLSSFRTAPLCEGAGPAPAPEFLRTDSLRASVIIEWSCGVSHAQCEPSTDWSGVRFVAVVFFAVAEFVISLVLIRDYRSVWLIDRIKNCVSIKIWSFIIKTNKLPNENYFLLYFNLYIILYGNDKA